MKRPADINELAKLMTGIATGEIPDTPSSAPNRARGGKVEGPARADKLTKERRAEIARKAAKARWSAGGLQGSREG